MCWCAYGTAPSISSSLRFKNSNVVSNKLERAQRDAGVLKSICIYFFISFDTSTTSEWERERETIKLAPLPTTTHPIYRPRRNRESSVRRSNWRRRDEQWGTLLVCDIYSKSLTCPWHLYTRHALRSELVCDGTLARQSSSLLTSLTTLSQRCFLLFQLETNPRNDSLSQYRDCVPYDRATGVVRRLCACNCWGRVVCSPPPSPARHFFFY